MSDDYNKNPADEQVFEHLVSDVTGLDRSRISNFFLLQPDHRNAERPGQLLWIQQQLLQVSERAPTVQKTFH